MPLLISHRFVCGLNRMGVRRSRLTVGIRVRVRGLSQAEPPPHHIVTVTI